MLTALDCSWFRLRVVEALGLWLLFYCLQLLRILRLLRFGVAVVVVFRDWDCVGFRVWVVRQSFF